LCATFRYAGWPFPQEVFSVARKVAIRTWRQRQLQLEERKKKGATAAPDADSVKERSADVLWNLAGVVADALKDIWRKAPTAEEAAAGVATEPATVVLIMPFLLCAAFAD
jgi:hypothetical protein